MSTRMMLVLVLLACCNPLRSLAAECFEEKDTETAIENCPFLLQANLKLEVSQLSYGLNSAENMGNHSNDFYNVPTEHLATADIQRYGETVAFEGKIYSAPHDAPDLLVHDTADGTVSTISTESILDRRLPGAHWLGIHEYEGKIYAAPSMAENLLVYDPRANLLSGVSTSSVASLFTAPSGKWNGITAWRGKIYAAPHGADKMLVYDIASGALSGVPTNSICLGSMKWMGLEAVKGKLYAAPIELPGDVYHCDNMLVYDTNSGVVSGISTAKLATGAFKWHGMASFNNQVYAVPHHADYLLIYNVDTQTLSGASTKGIADGGHKWAGITVLGGKIYGGPGYVNKVLEYDPVTNKMSSTSPEIVATPPCAPRVDTDGAWACANWNGIAGWNDKLYCSPYNTTSLLVYNLH